MTETKAACGLLLSVWLVAGTLAARVSHAAGPQVSEARLEATEAVLLPSSFSAQQYRIRVALPYGYHGSEERYPVLYLLDADVLFGLVTDTTRLLPLEAFFLDKQRVPAMIVIGVGYPGGVAEMSQRRGWDFNPPEEINPDGAANFYRFLAEDLIPWVETTYRAKGGDRTLVAASRGGLFALSTLLLHPATFLRYVVLSPEIEPALAPYAQAFEDRAPPEPRRVFLSAGSAGEPEGSIAVEVAALSEQLLALPGGGLVVATRAFDGESHASVLPLALVEGLVAVFADRD